ncbi:MAG: DUF29 domain-containing protein [Thiohalocapsa sp.]
MGKSEQRELVNRMASLLAHLVKRQMQPGRRGASSEISIRNQRRGIDGCLNATPSLRPNREDLEWCAGICDDATGQAASETGLSQEVLPAQCPFGDQAIFDPDFRPDQ